tara:strand:- start:147 stop:272 length:126 start_codon:yes stop_codon:yes gene_type:complete
MYELAVERQIHILIVSPQQAILEVMPDLWLLEKSIFQTLSM